VAAAGDQAPDFVANGLTIFIRAYGRTEDLVRAADLARVLAAVDDKNFLPFLPVDAEDEALEIDRPPWREARVLRVQPKSYHQGPIAAALLLS
jgi:hypothetical protein